MFNIFSQCSTITEIIIPTGVKDIGQYAFSGCDALSTVTILCETIGKKWFNYCKINKVVLDKNVKTIGEEAFSDCSNLKDIVGGSNVVEIDNMAFCYCSSLTSISIPNKVNRLGSGTFLGCSKLKTVKIGKEIKSISENVFQNCFELTEILCAAKEVPETSLNTFNGINMNNVTLYVPSALEKAYKSISPWSDFKAIIGEDSLFPELFMLVYCIDNVEYKTIEMAVGSLITPEIAPIKEGYTFSGWSDIPNVMPNHDIILNGYYTINKHNLIYKIDGEEYKTYVLDYGSSINVEAPPIKEGYTFSGWSNNTTNMPDHDVIVEGYYVINKHNVIYMVDGKEYKSYILDYGSEIIPEDTPVKEGYTFSGWSDIPTNMPDHDVTITGSFVANKYRISYMLDGEVYKIVEYEYGKKVTPLSKPSGNYATFVWENVPTTMPANDVVVYAKYTIKEPEPEPTSHRMVMSFKNRDIVSFVLKDKPQISFNGGFLVIESSTGTIEYTRSDIEGFHFEEIETSVESMEYSGENDIVIYDMNGRLIAKLHNESLNSAKLYLSEFKPGMYIIKVGNQKSIKYLKK